jgi:hypothetical protein
MFTILALGMSLSGAVAVETPIKAAADRPALVQVAANGGKGFHKKPVSHGKPAGIGHVEYERLGKPILAEKLRKPILAERFDKRIIAEKLRKPIIDERLGRRIIDEKR